MSLLFFYALGLSENDDSDSAMEKELAVDENGGDKPNDHSSDCESVTADQADPETSSEVSEVQIHKEQTDIVVKSESSESEMILESCNTLKRVSVPNNILFLKRLDEEDASIAGRSCLLFSAIPLPAGSCIGPFKGEIVSLSSIKQGDLVLQVRHFYEFNGFIFFYLYYEIHLINSKMILNSDCVGKGLA